MQQTRPLLAIPLLVWAGCQSADAGAGADSNGGTGVADPVSSSPAPLPDAGRLDGDDEIAAPCCVAGDSPGCVDEGLEACICAMRPECCTERWDETCVRLVNEKHCEVGVRKCVCEDWEQSDCCSGTWSTFCQVTAQEKCQAAPACPAAEPVGGDGQGSCCEARNAPGCSDAAVEECVCALVPDCCSAQWDAVCVQLVNERFCEDGVRECVCEEWMQGDCCSDRWTSFCAITAEEKCGAGPSCN